MTIRDFEQGVRRLHIVDAVDRSGTFAGRGGFKNASLQDFREDV
ncbi:hypothetical protein X745_16575 [Mesorhizobium sp. LNJC374B00]|nr:hypothetical protein X745_16575 [Mesorhizobium sp. LNJC374B00]